MNSLIDISIYCKGKEKFIRPKYFSERNGRRKSRKLKPNSNEVNILLHLYTDLKRFSSISVLRYNAFFTFALYRNSRYFLQLNT